MRLSVDTLVYEAVLRQLRNAVVEHVRTCFLKAFPDDWQDRLHRPFKDEEWESARRSAEMARRLGYVTREYKDDFDLLSVSNFFNLFESYFSELLPADELPPSEYAGKVRAQILTWLREVKGVRDPVAHPATDEMSLSDAVRVVDGCRRILEVLHLEEARSEVLEIYAELINRTSSSAPIEPLANSVDDTLPSADSIVIDFVGRSGELAALWSWYLDDTKTRWMLSGDGGKGKSAIAYRFASDVRASKPAGLCGVYWLSAKRRKFQAGSVISAGTPDFADLSSAINKLLTDFGWGDEVGASLDSRKATLLSLMDDFPGLIVLDDLDSIPPEEETIPKASLGRRPMGRLAVPELPALDRSLRYALGIRT